MSEQVNHPSNYASGGIECIDAMEAAFGKAEVASFCKLNAFKYLWRCFKKGDKVGFGTKRTCCGKCAVCLSGDD